MRQDATFIGIEVDDSVAGDAALAAKLAETCPVDIYADEGGRVGLVEDNIDECILCDMCVHAAPDGSVRVHKLYEHAQASR
jgi:NAD-dependent dihydropyrimidine dehydrogenase PreA subunit